ncbi:MAG TPA: NBR1-Ig-like domain-containing protein [Thermoanaerobaculia bacterium]|nr:NBR1-Ig-like domain-containing protein [Thermoanaerobaculia bacterium]
MTFRRSSLLALVLAFLAAVPLAAADASPFGVNIHSPQGAELIARLDQAKRAGFGWVRIDFVWAFVEPAQDQFFWQPYDDIVAAARARGLSIYATLAYAPPWATDGPEISGVPRSGNDWADVCFHAADRYRGQIAVWGMWNEPNLDRFWSGSRSQYIDLILKPGADAIRSADAGAMIAGPDLAHLTSGDSDWFVWLRDILGRASDRLDIVSHHIYDRDGARDVTKKLDDNTQFGGTPSLWPLVNPSLREVLREAGWFGRPVWLTETGWATDQVGDGRQASYFSALYSDWFTQQPGREWLDKIFIYELIDDPTQGVPKWGLLRPDGAEKPSFAAVRGFIDLHTQHTDGAEIVSSTFPATLNRGASAMVSVTVRNLGTTVWTRADGYKLGAGEDSDPFTSPRKLLGRNAQIRPGQTATFLFRLTAPTRRGTYVSDWQMLKEGLDRFGSALVRSIRVK